MDAGTRSAPIALNADLPPQVHLKRPWSPVPNGPSDEMIGSMQREFDAERGPPGL
jgi:hypothetical protein